MTENEKYREQYCKKHNQHYASFLPRCPICAGDELGKQMEEIRKIPFKSMEKEASKNMEDKGV